LQSIVRRGIEKRDLQSLGEAAYDIIAEKILSGELLPGQKLSIRAMAKLTGVSIMPVLEALHRLEYEGLVEFFPRWGSRVVMLTSETSRDRNALREAVECQAVRLLAEAGVDKGKIRALTELAESLDSMPRTDTPGNAFWDRHYEFHMLLAKYTGCDSLSKSLHNVNLFHLLHRNILAKSDMLKDIPGDLHTGIGGKNDARTHPPVPQRHPRRRDGCQRLRRREIDGSARVHDDYVSVDGPFFRTQRLDVLSKLGNAPIKPVRNAALRAMSPSAA
jgi:DNA-binding GntR family transcriptional regulator